MKNPGRILWLHRFSLAGLLLFVSLLGLDITQPVEFSAAATSQPAGLTSPSNTHVVAVSDSRIDVYWQDNSNNETGFEVHRSIDGSTGTFTLLATTAAGVTARGDLGLNPSTQYCYKVRAIKTADGRTRYSNFSNTACATTLAPRPPNAPSNTHVVAVSDSRIDVSWQDNSANETGFEVHRSANGSNGTFTVVASTTAGVTVRGDLGLNPSTQYCYKVRAFITVNSLASYSDFSNTACTTTLAPPPPPGLHVTGVTTGVDIDVDGYWVDVWKNSGGSLIHVTGIGLPANGTMTISGLDPADYQVELSRVAVNCDLTSPNPQTITLGASGSAGFAEFDVMCAPVMQLAFSSTVDGNPEIYVINSNGTGSTRLTLHPAADGKPAWSPDGTKIAFQSDRDGNAEIYVMNADGSNPVRLTNHPAADAEPTWSPDGTKIAFTSERDGSRVIYVMNADGAGVTQLSAGGAGALHSHPAWYPDGQKIAFVAASCQGTCSSVIQVVRANGTDLVELTSGADPAWRYPTVPTGISCLFDECPPQFYCGQNGVCITFCGDGYWNGDEGDLDCGGSCTPRCQSGQHCWVQSDCASGICVGGVCQ